MNKILRCYLRNRTSCKWIKYQELPIDSIYISKRVYNTPALGIMTIKKFYISGDCVYKTHYNYKLSSRKQSLDHISTSLVEFI